MGRRGEEGKGEGMGRKSVKGGKWRERGSTI